MSGNTLFVSNVITLSINTTTNLLSPGATTGGVNAPSTNQWFRITQIIVGNQNAAASPVSFALWFGATATNATTTAFPGAAGASTGTALNAGTGVSVAGAGGIYIIQCDVKMSPSNFFVGGASATGLTIIFMGEQGLVP